MKTVIRSVLAVALVGAVLGLTQTARAEEKKAEHQKMTGEIKAVDAKAGTITLAHRTGEVTFTAAPGTYTFYCAIPGHESIGMRGTLTVR